MARRNLDLGGFKLGVLHLDDEAGGAKNNDDLVSVLVFNVGSEVFAVKVDHTEGVVDCPGISPLPGAPAGIVGVTSVRGRITIVMDLSFGRIGDGRRRLILLRGEAQLGLLAGRIEGVVALKPDLVTKKAADGRRTLDGDCCFDYEGKQVPIVDPEKLTGL